MTQGLALESGEFIPAEELNKMMNAKSKFAHVQNPAVIEHVAGDVSKNGPESNMLYAELPDPVWRTLAGVAFSEKQLRAFADATHALRTQQTAPAAQQAVSSAVMKAIREANMQLVRTGDDAFMLVPYKVATAQAAESVQDLQSVHDAVTIDLLNERVAYLESKLKVADSVLEDAARYQWLFGARTDAQAACVSETVFKPLPQDEVLSHLQGFYMSKPVVDALVDAARKQGANHD